MGEFQFPLPTSPETRPKNNPRRLRELAQLPAHAELTLVDEDGDPVVVSRSLPSGLRLWLRLDSDTTAPARAHPP